MSCSQSPGFVSVVDEVFDVSVRCHDQFGQVFDIRTQQRMFTNSQPVLVLGVQQVSHVLAVNLHVADLVRPPTMRQYLINSKYTFNYKQDDICVYMGDSVRRSALFSSLNVALITAHQQSNSICQCFPVTTDPRRIGG